MAIIRQRVENGGLILFLVLITIALGLVVSSFAGALLWAALAALLFQPLFQWLLAHWPDRRNTAAAMTLLLAMRRGSPGDLGIGFYPEGGDPAPLRLVEEPAMAAADIKQRQPGKVDAVERSVQDNPEIALPQFAQRGLARGFVELFVLASDPGGNAVQRGGFEPAGRAAMQPVRFRLAKGGVADRAEHDMVILGEC